MDVDADVDWVADWVADGDADADADWDVDADGDADWDVDGGGDWDGGADWDADADADWDGDWDVDADWDVGTMSNHNMHAHTDGEFAIALSLAASFRDSVANDVEYAEGLTNSGLPDAIVARLAEGVVSPDYRVASTLSSGGWTRRRILAALTEIGWDEPRAAQAIKYGVTDQSEFSAIAASRLRRELA